MSNAKVKPEQEMAHHATCALQGCPQEWRSQLKTASLEFPRHSKLLSKELHVPALQGTLIKRARCLCQIILETGTGALTTLYEAT